DRAKVGASLEQVRRECVAKAVRVAEQPPDGARVETASACRDEEGVVRPARELWSPVREVAGDVVGCFLAERDDTLLPALAAHVDGLALEVHVDEIEPDHLRAAQAAGVQELEQRAVAERERRIALDELQQRSDL